MSRRGDNIHKRKDGRWEGRYRNAPDEFGKVRYSSVYGKTYNEVKTKLSSVFQLVQEEKSTFEQEKTFEEILSLWKNTNKIKHKGSTELKYDYLINKHILPNLGKYKISKISKSLISNFINDELQNGRIKNNGTLSVSYVKTLLIIVNSVLKFAQEEGFSSAVPNLNLNLPIAKKELNILNTKEQVKLKAASMQNINGTKLGILITLYTGLRIGEICALTWNDIDFESRVLHVNSTVSRVKSDNSADKKSTVLIIDSPKTKSSLRKIPICSELFPILFSMSKTANSKYVVSECLSFVSPRTFEYRFHKIIKECGIRQIN